MDKQHDVQIASKNVKGRVAAFIVLTAALAIAGALFVFNTWENSVSRKENAAIDLAEAAEAGMSHSHISQLTGTRADVLKPEYQEIKENLIHFTLLNNEVQFAYLFVQKKDGVYFAADSEPAASSDYSPPGQKYEEADEDIYKAFETAETVLSKPQSDRWGSWVSVLVPIKNSMTGEVTAVFGVDYPADHWNAEPIARTVQAAVMVLFAFAIVFILHMVILSNVALRKEKQRLLLAEAKLKESETLFRTIFDQATIGVALVQDENFVEATDSEHPYINPMFEKILGRTKEELAGLRWEDITHPDDIHADMQKFKEFKAGEIPGYSMEKRFIKPDGSEVWANMMISPLYLGSGSDRIHLCVIEDIGERKKMQKVLYDSERSKSILLNNLPGMAYRCKCDRNWTMEFVTEGCYDLTGYKPEELIDNCKKAFNDLILPQYQGSLWTKWEEALKVDGKIAEEYQIVTSSGKIKWVWEQGQGIYDQQGEVIALEGMILDITKRKSQEIKLKYINRHDTLSGLYNRKYFEEMFHRDISDFPDTKKVAVLINIRKFGLLNTAYGYSFGDSLIKEIASKLERFITPDCVLFHISIDRFILYLKNYKGKDDLIELCTDVLNMLHSILAPRIIGANIGVVKIDGHETDADNVIKNASIAADKVSASENFGFRIYSADMADEVLRKNRLKNELSKEVYWEQSERLYMLYQPIIDLRTDEILEFEALARFNSKKYGEISPVEFIPIAEETQLIVPLGKRVIRQVCQALKRFEEQYKKPLSIAFNLSAVQLLRDDFIPDLKEIIEDTGTDPQKLTMELTESIFSDNYIDIDSKLSIVREWGIKIFIDDFGTGYSSLAKATELGVDGLKIDKCFIDKLIDRDQEKSIAGDIISLAHKLGQCVVAEGVEDETQKKYLIEHHCDRMQGYLFSEPLSEEVALTLLLKNQN